MTTILAWLIGTKLGRYVAIGGLIAVGVGLLVLRIYSAGKAAEQAKQAQQSLKNLRTRIQTDDEITRLNPDDRRKRLSEWVSDN